ncbi:hypothetical protein WA1_26410 [Scytonema hofmannii PCC 7110]|uniref:Sortilin N-terminal domain-containing protein n=1 Tax=Scytonema hofmannii PCC 7110 TaxID=128403 RepID=A0A139X6Y2_9CYAN|nr:hypothetical protein [Scytonema hofmannii]KYC40461.1 hypothetical protein WA1_26410 [Scytonema hofmannii PCC 7110]
MKERQRTLSLKRLLLLLQAAKITDGQGFYGKSKTQTVYWLCLFFTAQIFILLSVIFLRTIVVKSASFDSKTRLQILKPKVTSEWKNVAIGGGGYVTDIYLHPQESSLVYIRTDNGGFFRWNLKEESWIPLTDHLTSLDINYSGGEALAVDPKNPNVVYIAAGKYLGSPGAIFKSQDRGKTWIKSNLQIPMGGDLNKRWTGNRLVVSPRDSNILLFGSRQNGLWRSNDGGTNWFQVKSLPAKPDPKIGILAIAFDPKVPNQAYLSAYGDGVYQSQDGGMNWSKIPGSPEKAMKLAVSCDKLGTACAKGDKLGTACAKSKRTLYVTSASTPGVSKFVNGAWRDITPPWLTHKVFNGLSTHPKNPQEVLVALGETGSAKIFHSHNGGNSWTEKRAKIHNTVSWWSEKFFSDHTSAIEFNPQTPNQVWLTDWFGVWRTENINTDPTLWKNYTRGHEQVVTFTLVSPPSGALLLSGIADVEGFYHNSLYAYPRKRLEYTKVGFFQEHFQDTYSIAYSANQPKSLVRVGGDRWNSNYGGATSKDGGLTWQQFPKFPANTIPLRVSSSANDPKNFVVVVKEGKPLQTRDGGKSWRTVSGLPNGFPGRKFPGPWIWSQPLTADGVKGNRFYYYADGKFYRSDDGGLTFSPINTSLPKANHFSVKTMPHVEGEVWVGLDEKGLYHSTNGGKTFHKIPQVKRAKLISLGKAPQDSSTSVLYLYGTVASQTEGIFSSLDRGNSWRSIAEPSTPVGEQVNVLEASQQQFGLVFIGTSGRGVYFRQVSHK